MLSDASRRRVAIVGGGITGLAAAHKLQSIAPEIETILIEAENRLGGKILTEQVEGYTIEGGPDSFLSSKPHGIELCHQLGLADQLEPPNPQFRRTYVMRDNNLYPMPEGLTGLIPSKLAPMVRSRLISPGGKFRLGLDYLLPSRQGSSDESLGDFIERRLGREVYERLVEPLMAGIYAGNGKELSLAATFPQLRNLERQHGGLLRGIRESTKSDASSSMPAARRTGFLAPRRGMGQIVESLLTKLDGVRLIQAQGVRSLRESPAGYVLSLGEGREVEADVIILAVAAYQSANLMEPINPFLSSVLRRIPYVSTITLSLGYPLNAIPRSLDGYGYVIPRREGRPVLACTWTSSKFPDRCPPDRALLRVFLGRSGQEEVIDLADRDLENLARNELSQTLGIRAEPDLRRIFRWPKAMPQYTLGHLERLDTLKQGLQVHPGLLLAGNAYGGVGIPDCIKSGEQAAIDAVQLGTPGSGKRKPES